MMRTLTMSLLMLGFLPAAQAAGESPDQCFNQARMMPADQQESFLKTCLGGETANAPATVTPEQRAKVCDSNAEREHFKGEQKAAFLKGCKSN